MNNILEPLLNSPLLPVYVAELTKILQEERLRKNEFLNWINESHKAEFIKGAVIMHAPDPKVNTLTNNNIEAALLTYLATYHLGVVNKHVAVNMMRGALMPDLAFWKKEVSDSFTVEAKLFPAPAFIIEVLSPSTEANDRGYKMAEYASNGVQEYWLVSPEQQIIEQYILKEEEYHLKEKLAHGTVQCYVLHGLEIALTDIFSTNE